MKIMRYDNMPNAMATMKNTEHTKRWSRCEATDCGNGCHLVQPL